MERRLGAGPSGTATFKERGGHHRKPMKKTKKEQAKIWRDRRRVQGGESSEKEAVANGPTVCELGLARRPFTALG